MRVIIIKKTSAAENILEVWKHDIFLIVPFIIQ